LFGADRALLLDTGSRRGNLAPTLQLVIHRRLSANHRDRIPLVVGHTHSHADHVAGDAELQALGDPDIPITYVAPTVEATVQFYGIERWHVYDRQTAILLTGDSVYPGRLYIRDFDAFEKSNQRMIRFTAGKPVAHLLGNHIEQQRTPYTDYPVKTEYQPDEH